MLRIRTLARPTLRSCQMPTTRSFVTGPPGLDPEPASPDRLAVALPRTGGTALSNDRLAVA